MAANAAPANEPTLSAAQARELSQPALADAALALLRERIVEVDGVPPKGLPPKYSQTMGGLNLALKPVPGEPGLCVSTALHVGLEQVDPEDETPAARERFADVRVRARYKVVGPTDRNTDSPTPQTCAAQGQIAANFFMADDDVDVSASVGAMQGLASAPRGRISCETRADCRDLPALIATLTVGDIVFIENDTPCPQDRSCSTILLSGAEGRRIWHRALKLRTVYRGVGPRGRGIVRVDRLVIGARQEQEAIPIALDP
ncbi:hypothetical protein [Caulobacter zeae]|nr:hypothetical protein [Caulobacter zeae]